MNDNKSSTQLLSGVTRIRDIIDIEEANPIDLADLIDDLLAERDKAEKEHQIQQIQQSVQLEAANSLATRYLTKLRKVDPKYFSEMSAMSSIEGLCLRICQKNHAPGFPITW